ncbi:probable LRR receptor-like serine/threonine-protein kinase At3g47570 [Helianthus annuus]|uniref:probable LRR receptor-like serine/threonine-protein kinase At3g47570 n=1 Tax=Helianthus annuus TaxID=4232 RepID=UPI000B9018BB|nr:probable LRR receptor-like serine/threonine-protein kinase At3g47570 [Helianthus annuus]
MRLKRLAFDSCRFQGALPRSIGNLSNQLQQLLFHNNQLHGNLPSSIRNLVGLNILTLGRNQFTGNIPSTIEGVIPSTLGNCHHILSLFLNDNKVNGKIPVQLLQLSSLSIVLDLSQNNLFGSLPIEVGNLNMLTTLKLSDDNFSGNIPSSLGGCSSLLRLSLKGNLFQDTIPLSLNSLKGLAVLDISHNNLSGHIPRFFEQFKLKYLNLSYNDFEGEVPMVGVFVNESAFSVLGNRRLCGGIIELGLPKCKETSKFTKKLHLYLIVTLIASALFTATCLAYAWCKKKRKSHLSQSSTCERHLKVSYSQLLKATNGFSESKLIGTGGYSSVYKGILFEDKNTFVAIKVLHLQNRGAQ